MSSVEVSCLPGDLPEYIEVDILDLELGSSIHMSALVLPEGLEIPALTLGEDHDQVVVAVHVPRRAEELDEPVADAEAAEGDEQAAADGESPEEESGDD
jgi:large subunit ribosomal protein L25